MRYKLLIFDMDGTILNTLEDLADATNYALRENGLPSRSIEEVRCFVGNGIGKLIERAVPEGTGEDMIARVFHTFHAYYKEHCADKTKPYEGIRELISGLRKEGYKTAVVSNKAHYAVLQLCEDYFNGLFDMAVGDQEGMGRKPEPDMVDAVLKKLGVSKEEAVYIGDSEVDYATAANAHMDLIMVEWGFRTREVLEKLGADKIAKTPEEIRRYLV